MDEVAKYNMERWAALAKAQAVFTRPRLDLTPADAQTLLDPDNQLGEVFGKQVLCLAGGGGQQSIAFALLGANVTVLDLSAAQLQRDVEAAAHYNLTVNVGQGDMRDLSRFAPASFDVVYHPYSLNFVPEARSVFREVARVMRVKGLYHFNCANPFVSGLTSQDWNGDGYPLKRSYLEGVEITYQDEPWVFRGQRPPEPIAGPKEYRHTLGTLINGLVEHGFVIVRVAEEHLGVPDINAAPGTVEHFSAIAPPWLKFWASYRPDVFGRYAE